VHLTVDLHVYLIKVPLLLPEAPYPTHPLASYVGSKERPEPVPSVANGLMADVNPALGEQVFDIAQAQGETDLNHHDQPDHLG